MTTDVSPWISEWYVEKRAELDLRNLIWYPLMTALTGDQFSCTAPRWRTGDPVRLVGGGRTTGREGEWHTGKGRSVRYKGRTNVMR